MGQPSSRYQFWKTNENTDARKTDRRRGLGSVILVLGMPFFIVGVILTIVAYANTNEEEGVPVFDIIGPLFIGLAALCVVIGAIVAQLVEKRHLTAFCCIENGEHICCRISRGCCEGRNRVLNLKARRASVDSKDRLNVACNQNFSNTSGSRPESGKSAGSSDSSKSVLSLRLCKVYPSSSTNVSELPDT